MYAPALISIESSCSTFARRCSSSSLSPNQQTPQSFIIPLSLFQWKQSTVTVFLYRCSRPRFAFIPSLSPCNILPASLLSLNPKQIHLKPLSLPQTSYLPYHPLLLLLSLPLSFFIQENYTQLFLNPVCCFLLFFLSIHLSLSFFSFSSLVSLCSLGLRLSLYLSLRWRLRGGNDGAFWLKQVERPPKPKPLNRELTACPLLTLICAHTYTCAREDPIHDRDNTTCLQTDFSSLKKKFQTRLDVANVMFQEVSFQGFPSDAYVHSIEGSAWPQKCDCYWGALEPGNTPASPQPKFWKNATCM